MTVQLIREFGHTAFSLNGGCSWCGQKAHKRVVWDRYTVGDIACDYHAKLLGELPGVAVFPRRLPVDRTLRDAAPLGKSGSHPATKACTKCGLLKPLELFYAKHTATDGRMAHCRACYLKRLHGSE